MKSRALSLTLSTIPSQIWDSGIHMMCLAGSRWRGLAWASHEAGHAQWTRDRSGRYLFPAFTECLRTWSWNSWRAGGGLQYFVFSPLFGEMIQFDDHIHQMGWKHQLDELSIPFTKFGLKESSGCFVDRSTSSVSWRRAFFLRSWAFLGPGKSIWSTVADRCWTTIPGQLKHVLY